MISHVSDAFKALSELKVVLIMKWLDFCLKPESTKQHKHTPGSESYYCIYQLKLNHQSGQYKHLGGRAAITSRKFIECSLQQVTFVWTHNTVMTTVGRKRQIHGDSEKVSVWREGGSGKEGGEGRTRRIFGEWNSWQIL